MQPLADLSRQVYLNVLRSNPRISAMAFAPFAASRGKRIVVSSRYTDILDADRAVRISNAHQFYAPDIIRYFDYYHGAVEPETDGGLRLVDYSGPALHRVKGYGGHRIMFPSLPEPVETARQYLDFAQLEGDAVVLDLGAYSGLTSILFDQQLGARGRTIAIDADATNLACIRNNVGLYQQRTDRTIEVLHAAVWSADGEIAFSAEGNMGSSAVAIVGVGRARAATVPCLTLQTLADRCGLDRVDFIKCDIEGAEAVIFNQPAFFERFRPRIVIELHRVAGAMTLDACHGSLERFGYSCRQVGQPGSHLPLLECSPAGADTRTGRVTSPPENALNRPRTTARA